MQGENGMTSENLVAGTQSLHRASVLLQEIAAAGQEGARLSELAQRTQLERATIHRMLKMLVLERWLQRDETSKRYRLGPLIFELSLCIPTRSDFRSVFEPVLDELLHASKATVYLNVRSGLDFVCMARRDGGEQYSAMIHDVGGRRPLGIGASGLALLLDMPPEESARIVQKNAARYPYYGRATQALAQESLDESRQLGYALSRDLDVVGLSAVGLPIHNAAGHAFAALSIVTPTPALTPERCEELVALARHAVQRIEKKIA
jgi:DNA-binding IclR family transcriptional regulator